MAFKKQAGFAVIEMALVVVLLAAVGLVAYQVYSSRTSNDAGITEQSNMDTSAQEIKTTEDLTEAEKTLDATDVEDSSTSNSLDTELSSF